MVEFVAVHGNQRKVGTDETAFLPTAVNNDQKRGSLLLNQHESDKLNLHLSSLHEAGSLSLACTLLCLGKPILDLLKPEGIKRKDAGPPAKCSAEMKYLYYVLSGLEEMITTRLGTLQEEDWPPPVTHAEYAAYRLAITPRDVPRSISDIKVNFKSYSNATQVLSDVYALLECDFKYLVPGSERWKNRVYVSEYLRKKIDDATNPPILDLPLMEGGHRRGAGIHPLRPDRDVTGSGSKMPTKTTARGTNSKKSKASSSILARKKPAAGKRAAVKTTTIQEPDYYRDEQMVESMEGNPILPEEHQKMNSLLGQLDEIEHGALYDEFRTAASWAVKHDAVELDDTGTKPTVFREMIAWCENQIMQ